MDRRTKRVSLSFLGEGWQDCYVEMNYATWPEVKKMIEADDDEDWVHGMITRIEQVYVSGKVLSDGQPVDMKKSDLTEFFDIESLKVLNNAALGIVNPKDEQRSATPSS